MCFSKKMKLLLFLLHKFFIFCFIMYSTASFYPTTIPTIHSTIISIQIYILHHQPPGNPSTNLFTPIHRTTFQHPTNNPPFSTQPPAHLSTPNPQPAFQHPTINPPIYTQPSTHLSTLSHQPTIQYLFTDLFQNPHLLKISLTKEHHFLANFPSQ